jgi:protein-tyrosine-phosphatase
MREKKRVLFVCIGNSCRSPMAEGFARHYGSDVIEVKSAGVAPAPIVQLLTKKVMADKDVYIDDLWPKDLVTIPSRNVDLLINMSGGKLPPRGRMEIREWKIEDPIGKSEEVYVRVRDEIEALVLELIRELREDGFKQYEKPSRGLLAKLSRLRG